MSWRIVSLFTTGLGLWTVAAHLCVLLGGNLYHLIATSTAFVGAALILQKKLGLELTQPDDEAPILDRRIVGATCAVSVLLALLLRGPNPDDTIYLNLAVTAADHPAAPLMSLDGLFGFDAPSSMLRPYFFHSIELFAAAAHVLTGIKSIVVMHTLLPAVAAVVVTLVQFELAKKLLPTHAHAAALGSLVFLLLVSDGWQSHGSHGFYSFTMGRALFVNGLLPIVFLATARVHLTGGSRSALFLCLSLFAAVGASSNALAMGPACVLLASLGFISSRNPGSRRALLKVAAAVAPILVLSLWAYGYRSHLHPLAPVDGQVAMQEVIDRAFGGTWVLVATWVAIVGGFWGMKRGPCRRALLAITLVLLFLTANPWTPGLLNRVIVREGMLPRMWLLLPIPMIVAIGTISMARALRAPLRLVGPLGVAITFVVFLAVPGRGPLKAGIQWDWTRSVNVYPMPYRLAEDLEHVTQPDDVVLTSQWRSMYVPAVHGHPVLFYTREIYEGYLADTVGENEAQRRRQLSLFVEGSPRADEFEPKCDDFDGIDVVVTDRQADRAREFLQQCGWEIETTPRGNRIWVRGGG